MFKILNFVVSTIVQKGSTLTLISLTPLYDEIDKSMDGNKCLGTVLMIAALMCIPPLLLSVLLAILDKKKRHNLKSQIAYLNESSEKSINFNAILKFPLTFWLVLLICSSFYCGIFPFISMGKVFFISKYGFSPFLASTTNR